MSSFTVGSDSGTFTAKVRGSGRSTGPVQQLRLAVAVASQSAWDDLAALATPDPDVRVSLGGIAIVDYKQGAGPGALVVDGYGTFAVALLTVLEQGDYLPGGRNHGTATFLLCPDDAVVLP